MEGRPMAEYDEPWKEALDEYSIHPRNCATAGNTPQPVPPAHPCRDGDEVVPREPFTWRLGSGPLWLQSFAANRGSGSRKSSIGQWVYRDMGQLAHPFPVIFSLLDYLVKLTS